MSKEATTTNEAPRPVARYSQAVRKGNILAVAGQVGVDPHTGILVGDDVASQTRQTLNNVKKVLEASGSSIEDVIMMRVYLTSLDLFEAMNKVYEEFVTEPYPSRTTVFVGLGPGMLVEIDVLAVLGNS
jgi:reactive intermediate/imine deaminase